MLCLVEQQIDHVLPIVCALRSGLKLVGRFLDLTAHISWQADSVLRLHVEGFTAGLDARPALISKSLLPGFYLPLIALSKA